MTMVASGQVDLGGTATSGGLSRSINLEFGYGANLNAYRGLLYTNAGGSAVFQFPSSSNSISMNAFYSTRRIPSGSASYTSTTSFSVPSYNTLSIVLRAGGGGGGGFNGVNNCFGGATLVGGAGSDGGQSSFGTAPNAVFASAPGGGGGYNGGSGTTQSGYAYDGNTSNAGGSGNGNGGGGGVTLATFTNPLSGGAGPASGSSITITIGSGGGGGGGGQNFGGVPCIPFANSPGGNGGGGGRIDVSWS